MHMKYLRKLFAFIAAFTLTVILTGCSRPADLTGTWVYKDETRGIEAVYDLKEDGTGTYSVTGSSSVMYELRYEVQNNHLLVSFLNSDTYSEDLVFDSEFKMKDDNTMVIRDSAGRDMPFIRQQH